MRNIKGFEEFNAPVNEGADSKLKDEVRELQVAVDKCYARARELAKKLEPTNEHDDMIAAQELLDQASDRIKSVRDALYKQK